jgi:hypothetical protein
MSAVIFLKCWATVVLLRAQAHDFSGTEKEIDN